MRGKKAGMRQPSGIRQRDTYIGGHDAAKIVGLYPYGAGAADVFAKIVRKTIVQQSAVMLRGLLMEDGLCRWVGEKRGVSLERDVFIVDDHVPFFAGSIDAVEPGGEVMHEFTTTTTTSEWMWGAPGTDDCAKHKWVQCQWYMGIDPSIREAHVWCFVVDGSDEPLHYIVPRNQVAIDELRTRCEEFWYEHILTKIPPLPGVHDADADEVMDALFPHTTAGIIDADEALVLAATDYAKARDEMKDAELRKKTAAARIKAALGEHEGASWKGGSVSWKDRSIGEKTNWEAVAHDVAMKFGVNGQWFNGLVRDHTFKDRSVRAMRVTVDSMKKKRSKP